MSLNLKLGVFLILEAEQKQHPVNPLPCNSESDLCGIMS